MSRFFIAASLVLTASSTSFAQDMPLSQILIDGEGWKVVALPSAKPKPSHVELTTREGAYTVPATTYSANRTTIFVATPGERYLWAAQVGADGKAESRGAPYARLRVKRGAKDVDVTSLATDKDGRIYATTELGVQVFDPIGRLCGVLTPAAEGKSELLVFEGDKLTLWIGDTKYERKLNTQGAK